MLTAAKNQIKISLLSVKFALVKEMLNKTTFITNVVFMILNNASYIIQWLVLYSLNENIGGYTFKEVMLLWGIAASTYGFAHFFFKNAYNLSDVINNGKLDAYLVQPKNVLLSCITTSVETSAIGDLFYGLIMLFVFGFNIKNLFLLLIFTVCGGLIYASYAVILGSLSFWFNKSDIIADTGNNLMIHFGNYPDGIFKGIAKIILYTIVPVGMVTYLPVRIITNFNLGYFLIIIGTTILLIALAFLIFYKGLKRYSSSNLMVARI